MKNIRNFSYITQLTKVLSDKNGVASSGTVLRIAAQSFPLYTPIFVAYESGYIDEELIEVHIEVYKAGFFG